MINNGGDSRAPALVQSPRLRGNWSIISSSDDYEKLNANTVQWSVEVPAKGEKTLTVSVRERHC